MNFKTTFVFVILLAGLGAGCTGPSTPSAEGGGTEQTQAQAKPSVFAKGGVAIRGYDPVAYFTEDKPVEGSSEFTHEWQGATWQFASAENRDRFASNPEQYAPQYGGYCAWAVKEGTTAPTDPQAWKIVDGKLYLNLNPGIQKRWEKDIPGHIATADQNWPDVLKN